MTRKIANMVEAVSTPKSSGAGRSPFENYKELMTDSLKKIKSTAKSKNKELAALCDKALGKLQCVGQY